MMSTTRRRHVVRVTTHERLLLALYRSLNDDAQRQIDALAFDGCNQPACIGQLRAAGCQHVSGRALLPFLRAKRLGELACGGVQ